MNKKDLSKSDIKARRMAIGIIQKVEKYREYYELSTTSGKPIFLFEDEVGDQKFIQGDIVSYETKHSEVFGMCAANPILKGNSVFEKLTECLKSKEPIRAYIYAESENGYEVDYNGYRCFLPFHQCDYKGYMRESQLMFKVHDFRVVAIRNGSIIVSLREAQKEMLERLKVEEIRTLCPGFKFIGEVTGVKKYGLFIDYKLSAGLLHVSRIIEEYDDNMSREKKNEIGVCLKEVFQIGQKLLVYIDKILEGKYTLDLETSIEPNKTMCNQLKRYLLNE